MATGNNGLPTMEKIIQEAIRLHGKGEKGCSIQAIRKYIVETHPEHAYARDFTNQFRVSIDSGLESGALRRPEDQTWIRGLNGRLLLGSFNATSNVTLYAHQVERVNKGHAQSVSTSINANAVRQNVVVPQPNLFPVVSVAPLPPSSSDNAKIVGLKSNASTTVSATIANADVAPPTPVVVNNFALRRSRSIEVLPQSVPSSSSGRSGSYFDPALAQSSVLTKTVVTQKLSSTNIRTLPSTASVQIGQHFHAYTGFNVKLTSEQKIASRVPGSTCNGYVFSCKRIAANERVSLLVASVRDLGAPASLILGFTTCDPASLQNPRENLPNDPFELFDRSEYWVFLHDAIGPLNVADFLTFFYDSQGAVHFRRNFEATKVVMHIETTQSPFIFFDFLGATDTIRLAGYQLSSGQPMASSGTVLVAPPPAQVTAAASNVFVTAPSRSEMVCTVCQENPLETVLRPCKHACLCKQCALAIKETNAICPICRAPVTEVEEIFLPY